jgi:hypothetical protein
MSVNLNDFIPDANLDSSNDNRSFSIITKNKAIGNLKYMGVSDIHAGNLEQAKEKYEALQSKNNGDQTYFIVDERLAQQFNNGQHTELSHDIIAQIINKTQKTLNIEAPILLTQKEKFEQQQKEDLENAQKLGLVKTEDQILAPYLPKELEENENDLRSFAIIAKNKAIGNLKHMSVSAEIAGSLTNAKTMCAALDKMNNGDWEFFIVKHDFPQQLSSLSENIILKVINKTQEILDIDKQLKVKQENTIVPPEPTEETVTPENKANLESIFSPITPLPTKDIPVTLDLEQKPVPPTPKELHNNYFKISEQLNFFKENANIIEEKKTPLSKPAKIITIALTGVIALAVSPIIAVAAVYIGAKICLKTGLKKTDEKELKLWGKRQDLLKQAAVEAVQGDYSKDKNNTLIEDIAFTPEIVNKYLELAKKAKIDPEINIEQLRKKFSQMGHPDAPKLKK